MTARRIEHDLRGELDVPNEVYWGIYMLHALENFRIFGRGVCELSLERGLLPAAKLRTILRPENRARPTAIAR